MSKMTQCSLLHSSFKNENGMLHFGGVNVLKLVEKYATPLYVYDQSRIEENIQRLRNAFESQYQPFQMLYAVKANNNPHILEVIGKYVDGADASYSTEIELASKSDFKIISFSGNYVSRQELEFGIKNADIINFDSISALEKTLSFGIPKKITFRINPGIGKGSFTANVFAGDKAKFGIPYQQACEAYKKAKNAGIKHFGIYMMTGSCIMDPKYFEIITNKLLEIAGEIKKQLGIKFEFINIGGGFGIPYRLDEKPLDINVVAKNVTQILKKQLKKHDLGNPILMIEPGRYIVGDSGILLTQVHDIKESYQNFAGVDASMNVLLRPALYDAYHHILLANRMNDRATKLINICGQICENADILAHSRQMPSLREGDILAILCAGAYGYSMSSNYNTRPRPAEVLVKNGEIKLIRRRETLTDMIRNTLIEGK